MGLQAYSQVLHRSQGSDFSTILVKSNRSSASRPVSRYAKVSLSMPRLPSNLSGEVSVIKDDKTQNAFALPGRGDCGLYGIFRWPRMKPAWPPFSAMQ